MSGNDVARQGAKHNSLVLVWQCLAYVSVNDVNMLGRLESSSEDLHPGVCPWARVAHAEQVPGQQRCRSARSPELKQEYCGFPQVSMVCVFNFKESRDNSVDS